MGQAGMGVDTPANSSPRMLFDMDKAHMVHPST